MTQMLRTRKIFHISVLLLSIFAILLSSSANAFALDEDKDDAEAFSIKNSINWYGKGCTTATPSIDSTPITAYKNPVIESNAPDPSIIRGDDGKFYLYATGFQQFVSDDMVNWKKLNDGIDWIKNNPGWSTDRWAPDIAKVGDTYVLSISGGSSGNRTIGYATSKSAAGPFTYQGQLVNAADRGKYGWGYDIDPNIVQTDKGIFLYYGSGRDYIKVAKLTKNGDKLSAGRSKTVFTTKYGEGPVKAEGTFVYKHGDYYYLYFSSGDYKISGNAPYRLRVARSKSPDKGFVEQKKPILEGNSSFTHPGHNSVITNGSDDFLVYHAYQKGKSDRAVLIDKITYENDWPVINNGNGPSSSKQTKSSATSGGGQIDITLSHANIQTTGGPGANYSKNQRDRFIGTMSKFSSSDPDFITLNEIEPNVDTNYNTYKSFKKNYPNAKTSEDSALRILWNSDRWKKTGGDIKLIHEYETDPAKQIGRPMNWKDRYALWATFQNIQNGATASVIVTHWNTSATTHKARAKTQGENLKSLTQELSPKGPVLIAGDFNFQIGSAGEPHSPASILGKVGVKSAFKKGDKTYVDWMLYSSQLKLTNKKVIPTDSSLSDHPYLVGKFQGEGGESTSANSANSNGCVCSVNNNPSLQTLPGKDSEDKAWAFLTGKGLSGEQAAGIMGNIYAESSFDPKVSDENASYIGISQWDKGGRWVKFKEWANNKNLDIWSFDTQLQYTYEEAEGRGNIEGIKGHSDIPHTAWYWGRYFEVAIVGGSSSDTPLTNVQHLDKRTEAAEKYFSKYNGTTGSASSSAGDPGGCPSEGEQSTGAAICSNANSKPPEDYGIVNFPGTEKKTDKRTLYMINLANDCLKQIKEPTVVISQGSYCSTGCAAASGASHDKGGTVDLSVRHLTSWGKSHTQIEKLIKVLREVGFAAWYRDEQDVASWSNNQHIHINALGAPESGPNALGSPGQVSAYCDGRAGAYDSSAKDRHLESVGRPLPQWAEKYCSRYPK